MSAHDCFWISQENVFRELVIFHLSKEWSITIFFLRYIKILCIGIDVVKNFNQKEAVLFAFKGAALKDFCGNKMRTQNTQP